MFDRNLTMRIDENTSTILNVLINDMSYSKSEVIRRSLRLLKELNELKKKFGEISVRTEAGEKVLVLLG